MKKVLALVLTLCMLFSLTTVSFAADRGGETTLQFNEDGNFRIFVLADVQDDYPIQDATIQYINEALDQLNPDLVVFDGDNIMTNDVRAYDQLLTPIVERDIPFTLVFGNHDDEIENFPKEEQLLEYQKYAGCLAYDADPDLHGCATHNLPIMSSDGSKVAFNLWMFDTGSTVRDENGEWLGYDCVRADQIEWYNSVRDEMTEANGGEVVPAIAFQHIIPQEPCEEIFYSLPFSLGELSINFEDGTHLSFLPKIEGYDGLLFEKSCPSYSNEGQWDAMAEGGDVIGVVVGHDHVNDFIIETEEGIDLIQTPGVTYESYYNDILQGGRVIDINEENPEEYSTFVLTTNEVALQDGSKLPETDDRSNASYAFNYYFGQIFKTLYEMFASVFKTIQ